MSEKYRKVLMVGDGMVGKTALLSAFINEYFNQTYVPTVFETSAKDVELNDGRRVTLGLWDTAGQEEFDQIRQLAYPGTDLILLCYAVNCRTSLENILDTWIHEIRGHCPSTPVMLVGCKADQRICNASNFNNSELSLPTIITPQEAQQVSKLIGAHLSIECSAMYNLNVQSVFEIAARLILDMDKAITKKPSFLRRLRCNSFNQEYPNPTTNNCSHFKNLKSGSFRNSILMKKISLKRKNSSFKYKFNSPNYFCFIRRH